MSESRAKYDAIGAAGWRCCVTVENLCVDGFDNGSSSGEVLVVASHADVHGSEGLEVQVAQRQVKLSCRTGVDYFDLPRSVDPQRGKTSWSQKRLAVSLRLPIIPSSPTDNGGTQFADPLQGSNSREFPTADLISSAVCAEAVVGSIDGDEIREQAVCQGKSCRAAAARSDALDELFLGFPVRLDEPLGSKNGRRLVATRNLFAGEVVFSEDASVAAVADDAALFVCHHCHVRENVPWTKCTQCCWAQYCSDACKAAAACDHAHECEILMLWRQAGQQRESRGLRLLLRLAKALRDNRNFAALIQKLCGEAKTEAERQQALQQAKAIARFTPAGALHLDEQLLADLIPKVHANIFGICDLFGELSGPALYVGGSLLNHSCRPNTAVSYVGTRAVFRALHTVPCGEEVCHAYINVSLPAPQRQLELRRRKGFSCECPRCAEEEENLWRKAANTNLEAIATLVHNACVARQQGKLDEAKEACHRVLASSPPCQATTTTARHELAEVFFAERRWHNPDVRTTCDSRDCKPTRHQSASTCLASEAYLHLDAGTASKL